LDDYIKDICDEVDAGKEGMTTFGQEIDGGVTYYYFKDLKPTLRKANGDYKFI